MDLFLTATSLVSDANTWFDFLGTTFSAVSELLSGWRHKQERRHGEAERRQLQWKEEDMKMKQLHYCLLDLPDLINHAEWFSYIKDDKEVAKLLPELRVESTMHTTCWKSSATTISLGQARRRRRSSRGTTF